jgi:serine/threonine-protein kinase RsbW
MQMLLKIPADYQETRTVKVALRRLCKQAKVSDELAGLAELALQELLTNIIRHSYHEDARQVLSVAIQIEAGRLVIETEDAGSAYIGSLLEKAKMPDPALLQEHGYGLAIIKALMDEVAYRREYNRNIWRLEKRVSKG